MLYTLQYDDNRNVDLECSNGTAIYVEGLQIVDLHKFSITTVAMCYIIVITTLGRDGNLQCSINMVDGAGNCGDSVKALPQYIIDSHNMGVTTARGNDINHVQMVSGTTVLLMDLAYALILQIYIKSIVGNVDTQYSGENGFIEWSDDFGITKYTGNGINITSNLFVQNKNNVATVDTRR